MDVATRANDHAAVRSFDMTSIEFRDDGPTGFTFEGCASVVSAPYQVRVTMGECTRCVRQDASGSRQPGVEAWCRRRRLVRQPPVTRCANGLYPWRNSPTHR